MRKTTTPAATGTAAPLAGGAAQDLFERLAAPFDPAEVRTRRGPRGDLKQWPSKGLEINRIIA